GNESGDINYQVSFQVINAMSISDVQNHPNPFIDFTRFGYTLTGDRSPDFYQIEIANVDGEIVRVLTKDDLGELRVGKHLTDYKFYGTDKEGRHLPAGIYFYRLTAEDSEGDNVKHRNVGIPLFKRQGWGKMIKIR
ncbi:MAG: hypothetical protein R3275_03640, partial [Saprospiraceae bacterium]|nr:hypothetical protein [Saprospiraceae bacterium]